MAVYCLLGCILKNNLFDYFFSSQNGAEHIVNGGDALHNGDVSIAEDVVAAVKEGVKEVVNELKSAAAGDATADTPPADEVKVNGEVEENGVKNGEAETKTDKDKKKKRKFTFRAFSFSKKDKSKPAKDEPKEGAVKEVSFVIKLKVEKRKKYFLWANCCLQHRSIRIPSFNLTLIERQRQRIERKRQPGWGKEGKLPWQRCIAASTERGQNYSLLDRRGAWG